MKRSLSRSSSLACPVGKLSESLYATECDPCPSGGFCNAAGAASLSQTFTQCPTGTYNALEGQSTNASCAACPVGKANPVPGSSNVSACLLCLPGSFAPSKGFGVCAACPAGFFQNVSGATFCKPCPLGHYCREGSSTPMPCPAGTHNNQTSGSSASECPECPTGKWCSAGLIIPCPFNTFNDQTGADVATVCERCPPYSQTTSESSTTIDACECVADYFDAMVGQGVVCNACPLGTECTGGSTIDTLPLVPGWWRTGPTSLTMEKCPHRPSCLGGSDSSAYCLEGAEGPLCMVCSDGYRHSSVGGCVPCQGDMQVAELVGFMVSLCLLLLACLCCCCQAKRVVRQNTGQEVEEARGYREPAKTMGQRILTSAITKLKIMTAHQQVLQGLAGVFRISWPEQFKEVLTYFNFFSFDVLTIAPLECLVHYDFLVALYVRTLVPLGVVGLLLGGGRLAQTRGNETLGYFLLNSGVILVFLVYPIVTQTVFQFFQLKPFDDGTTTMMADYSIDADSSAYNDTKPTAFLMIAVWPIGVPLVITMLLWHSRAPLLEIRRREKILGRNTYDGDAWDEHVRNQKHLGVPVDRNDELHPVVEGYLWMLTEAYRGTVFYFEVIEYVLQKLTLVGLLVFFQPGTLEQLVMGLVVCFFYSLLCAHLHPFGSVADNLLAVVSTFALFVALLSAVVIEHGPEETPAAVTTVLIISAITPTWLALMLTIQLACNEMGWNPLAAITKPIEREASRITHSRRLSHWSVEGSRSSMELSEGDAAHGGEPAASASAKAFPSAHSALHQNTMGQSAHVTAQEQTTPIPIQSAPVPSAAESSESVTTYEFPAGTVIGAGFNDHQTGDVMVAEVKAGSPAEEQGVKVGMVLAAVNGESVKGRSKAEALQIIKTTTGLRKLTLSDAVLPAAAPEKKKVRISEQVMAIFSPKERADPKPDEGAATAAQAVHDAPQSLNA